MSTEYQVKQGGSFDYDFTFVSPTGDALDLTGFTVTSTANHEQEDESVAFVVTATDLSLGQVKLSLTPTVSVNMSLGYWTFDLSASNVGGTTVYKTATEILLVDKSET
jgi:hypothetical protein